MVSTTYVFGVLLLCAILLNEQWGRLSHMLVTISVLAGAFIYRLYVDNKLLLSKTPILKTASIAGIAFLKYLPLLATLTAGLSLHYWFYDYLHQQMYKERLNSRESIVLRFLGPRLGPRLDETDIFREDVYYTITTRAREFTQQGQQAIDVATEKGIAEIERQKNSIPDDFRKITGKDLIDRDKCNFFIRWACDSANGGYHDAATRRADQMQGYLYAQAQKATDTDTQYRAKLKEIVAEADDNTAKELIEYFKTWFEVMDNLEILAWFLLIFAIIKSLAYVFGREFLATTKHVQSFAPKGGRHVAADAALPDERSEVAIDLAPGEVFYIARSLNFEGSIEAVWAPQPFALLPSRIWNGKYILNKVVGKQVGNVDILITTAATNHFVEIDLKSEQRLFFKCRYLGGFSKELRFENYFSFRLLGFVFGELIYHCAVGPGRLLLAVPGGCSFASSKSAFAPHRLVAWAATEEMAVPSSQLIWDVYFSGVSALPSHGKSCILDNGIRPKRRYGIGRFFRRFFWPL